MNNLLSEGFGHQKILSESTGYSLGATGKPIKQLSARGLLYGSMQPTDKTRDDHKSHAPANAIILAAGYGMRMVPINAGKPKGRLEIDGEPLIERQIKQLHAVGITEIYVVVGFMKEQYGYLSDRFGVKLIVNSEYTGRNNLHSLALAAKHLHDTYIVPCDVWSASNPFNCCERSSWYMVSDLIDADSDVRVNRKKQLVKTKGPGNAMVGIAYLAGPEAEIVRNRLRRFDRSRKHDDAFWEETLYDEDRMIVAARIVRAADAVDINTYQQLRGIDGHSKQLQSDAINTIAKALGAKPDDVKDISILKKGMTNRSFLFECLGNRYIMRIPGEGTDKLINRAEEAEVYRIIAGKGICDDPVYINPQNGYKIMRFIEGVRVCDAFRESDVRACMKKLKGFHRMRLTAGHTFNIFEKIEFYEHLWEGKPSAYRDYADTKKNVFSLLPYITAHAEPYALSHIDAVCDNFLFSTGEGGKENLQLTDWEYSGMQDQDVDLAMFSIYAGYDRQHIDRLIDIYFDGAAPCPLERRIKIYCYVAACGLLWSNWCEYKRNLGVEFGEYSIAQYRYAKDYYRIVVRELEKLGQMLPGSFK